METYTVESEGVHTNADRVKDIKSATETSTVLTDVCTRVRKVTDVVTLRRAVTHAERVFNSNVVIKTREHALISKRSCRLERIDIVVARIANSNAECIVLHFVEVCDHEALTRQGVRRYNGDSATVTIPCAVTTELRTLDDVEVGINRVQSTTTTNITEQRGRNLADRVVHERSTNVTKSTTPDREVLVQHYADSTTRPTGRVVDEFCAVVGTVGCKRSAYATGTIHLHVASREDGTTINDSLVVAELDVEAIVTRVDDSIRTTNDRRSQRVRGSTDIDGTTASSFICNEVRCGVHVKSTTNLELSCIAIRIDSTTLREAVQRHIRLSCRDRRNKRCRR